MILAEITRICKWGFLDCSLENEGSRHFGLKQIALLAVVTHLTLAIVLMVSDVTTHPDLRLTGATFRHKKGPIRINSSGLYLFGFQARHATSRNSGTPVAIIRSPTQRMGDALNALRPQRLRTKAASSLLPQMAGRLFGMQFLLLSRAASTRRISELPCRLSGTKNHHFAKAPFP